MDKTNIDVINGKGQGVQRHRGNVFFRRFISAHKRTYAQAPKTDKKKISKGVVTTMRRFGARFLEYDIRTRCYHDIGDERAVEKTIQALREKQPEIRKELAVEMAQGTEDNTSPDTSTEESCVNFSMKIMQSLSKEEGGYSLREQIMMAQDQFPPQHPTPTPTPTTRALSPKIYNFPRPLPPLPTIRSLSDILGEDGEDGHEFSFGISAEMDLTANDPMDSEMNSSEMAKMAEEQAADFLSFECSVSDDEDRLSLMSFGANEGNFEGV